MVLYMEQYRAAKLEPAMCMKKNGTYGDEVMNASWNPALVHLFAQQAQVEPSPDLPLDLATVDVDAFLSRVYALASQV